MRSISWPREWCSGEDLPILRTDLDNLLNNATACLLDQLSKRGLLTSSEGYPSSILCSFSSPVGSHQQTTCDSQGNDSHDDKKQGGDPLWGKPGRDAGPVASMDCLTLPH